MEIYTQIEQGKYVDSLETLSATAFLNEQPGIKIGYVCMATDAMKDILKETGLLSEAIGSCDENCYVIAAQAESKAAFDAAAAAIEKRSGCIVFFFCNIVIFVVLLFITRHKT